MGHVAECFAAVRDKWDEHVKDHTDDPDSDDCGVSKPEAFAITDAIRADMLFVVNESVKKGLLDPEDEIDLEVAIGTAGDPEAFGWPSSTEPWQRFAVAGIIASLGDAVNPRSFFDGFSDWVKERFGSEGPDLSAVEGAIQVTLHGDTKIPERVFDEFVVKLKSEMLRDGRIVETDTSKNDWFTKGYL